MSSMGITSLSSESMLGKGKGRIFIPDPGDADYAIEKALASPKLRATGGRQGEGETPPKKVRDYRNYRFGPILDQGPTSSCTGQMARNIISCAPFMTKTGPDGFALYRRIQQVDEWPGEEPAYYGSSVRAAMRVLREYNYISQFFWAGSAEQSALWLLGGHGTIGFGTNWYTGMSRPDKKGLARPTGTIDGGHAYMCYGYSRRQGVFRFVNSWGTDWGKNGTFIMTGEDVERLIREDGDAVAVTQIPVIEPPKKAAA